jgi:hypothetical protein
VSLLCLLSLHERCPLLLLTGLVARLQGAGVALLLLLLRWQLLLRLTSAPLLLERAGGTQWLRAAGASGGVAKLRLR